MKIYCPCEKSFDVFHSESINLDEQPQLVDDILDGKFLTFTCPQCGRTIKSEVKTRIEWKSKKQILLFVPESSRIECLSCCAGLKKIDFKTNTEIAHNYCKKDETPVIGYAELSERVEVLKNNLNPHAVEVLKFIVLDSGKNIKNKKIRIFFHSVLDNGFFEFYVYGLKDDEVAVMPVPIKLYNSILTDLNKKKKSELFTGVYLGNYLSYQNIFTEGQEG